MGWCWCWKNLLVNIVTEYLKRTLRYSDQILTKPSVLVTASTGKAATGVHGTKLHSAFHLPVKTGNSLLAYRKPKDEELREMRNKHNFLKVLLIDEISMTSKEIFKHLHLTLQHIKENSLPFGGVSVMPI